MSSLRSFPPLGVAALLVATLGARGDEPPAVQADIGYASRYVFRGIERAGQSAQAGVELTRENFHTGLWLNQPLESNGTRETNLRMAYAGQPAKGLTLEASVTHSWFSDTPGGDVKRTLEAGLTAAVAAGNGFVPSVAYFHDFRLHANTTQVSLERSIALTKLGAFLELNFFAGWATGDNWRPDTPGPQRHDSYGYWGGEARLPYRIGPHSTVTAGLHYADATGRSATNGPFGLAARQNLWATLGVNLDF